MQNTAQSEQEAKKHPPLPPGLKLEPDNGKFKEGEDLACSITNIYPDGYSAAVRGDDRRALLITQEKLSVGDEVVAQFRGVYHGRLVLSAEAPIIRANRTSEDDELAVAAWSQPPHRSFKLKRATDLIMGPLDAQTEITSKVREYKLDHLIADLERNIFTGCIKIASEEKESRSALLLCRGRAVGCVYNCVSLPDTLPTEQALQMILSDLSLPETDLRMYKLPADVIFAMSSLFLGHAWERTAEMDTADAKGQLQILLKAFEARATTACLAVTLEKSQSLCLGFVHRGYYCGSYDIEEQNFETELWALERRLEREPQSTIEASALPAQMTSPLVRFGFSLSVARKRK
ncbi:MAG TPA: hypothetical protein V6C69_00330 [Trichormus sp.]|jgi:hypothetical protein